MRVIGKLTKIAVVAPMPAKRAATLPMRRDDLRTLPTYLTLWFHAMYLMTATRNGVSAKNFERHLA